MVVSKTFVTRLFKAHCTLSKCCYSTAPGLLNDVTVLDFTRVIAGPFCSMTLGDLGANVIKVESLDGDEARKWGPPFIKGSKESYYFLSVNRNKKSVCIDVKTEEGKKVFYDIAKKSDVMIENFIPGKLDKLQVGYEKLSSLNPKLIYCAITGFGPIGPYATKPGYDVIAAAMGGMLHLTGQKDGEPIKPAVPLTDICTGLHAFGAIMTALYHRQKSGKGQKIDCNLLSTQINIMINLASAYLNCGIEGEKWGTAHASIVPYQAFKAKDGYIVLGAGSDAQFIDLCTILNRADLIKNEKFKTNADRVKNRNEIINIISNMIVTKSKKEWTEAFKNATFPNGPVNTLEEVFDDDHVKAIGLVKELEHPIAGKVKVTAPPTVYSSGGNEVRCAPPVLGQHTRDVLSNFLGYTDAKIEKLFNDKIDEETQPPTVITLRGAPRTRTRKKVLWTEDTVDNEHMNKKKSKCCCIYEKPHKFGESDSEDSDDECEHCSGHVERRRTHQHASTDVAAAAASATVTIADNDRVDAPRTERTAVITLRPSDPSTSKHKEDAIEPDDSRQNGDTSQPGPSQNGPSS